MPNDLAEMANDLGILAKYLPEMPNDLGRMAKYLPEMANDPGILSNDLPEMVGDLLILVINHGFGSKTGFQVGRDTPCAPLGCQATPRRSGD